MKKTKKAKTKKPTRAALVKAIGTAQKKRAAAESALDVADDAYYQAIGALDDFDSEGDDGYGCGPDCTACNDKEKL